MAGLVLVAEDEGLSQKLVAAVIQYCDMDSKIVGSGSELMVELKSGVIPDIILLDLEMPEMSGIDVLKAIQSVPQEERCPIVVFTANNQEATVREAISLGADDFVVKPFKTADLAQRIKDLTYEATESGLKQTLHNLHIPDYRLGEVPSIKKRMGTLFDFYGIPSNGKPLCIGIPKGQSPQILARSGFRELRGKVVILRECGSGWKKVWPRTGRSLIGNISSAV